MRQIFALSGALRSIFAMGVVLLAAPVTGHAALQGRDVDSNAANGFEAFYDTVLNITWLADANYAKTSGYDADGAMTWNQASAWVAGLNFGGLTGWRLPHFEPLNGVAPIETTADGKIISGLIDIGFNITSPKHELSYMYYVNLGLKGTFGTDGSVDFGAGFNASGSQPVPGIDGAFISNLKPNMYWENVIYQGEVQKAWGFWTSFPVAGAQGMDYRYNDHYAWAVHSGDPFKVTIPDPGTPIPSVAEPSSAWLMAAGLGISALLSRKRHAAVKQAGAAV